MNALAFGWVKPAQKISKKNFFHFDWTRYSGELKSMRLVPTKYSKERKSVLFHDILAILVWFYDS